MATPNYGYEKRQRELAKKQKKEEKLRAKAGRKQGDGSPEDQVPGQDVEPGGSAQGDQPSNV
ncbi:hypothetical protein [Hydrogenophaga sp. RWCD_12]|uniref:hypothetical protein n=1 Tax=Hydrogenophaga sp. RWCD_12 TaxID=3391190 RepID=UPI00398463FC